MASKEAKLKIVVDAENRTQAVFNGLQRNLDAIGKANHGLISAMKTVGTAGSIAFGSLSLLTAGIVKAGAGFEQTQIAFETMLGSAEQAQKTLSDLSQFAARTPFELGQLEEASKRLLAYGTAADDLIPTLKMLGNISAGVGMDKLPQLILAFGQVQAATKLTGMELRQFSEAGVPLLGTLADQLGKTEQEVIEMVSAGEVGFEQVKLALAALTGEGGRFFELMDKQSQSLGGQWSNLKDQLALTARTIGEDLLPYMKPVLEQLIAMTQSVRAFVAEHPKLSAILLTLALGLAALLALLLPLAVALPGLIIMWGGLASVIGAVALVLGTTSLSMIAMIGLLAVIGYTAYKVAAQWQDAWDIITIVVAESANVVQSIVETMINFVIDGINGMIQKVNSLLSRLSDLPIVGKKFRSLSLPELDQVAFNRFDTGAIYNGMMDRPRSATAGEMILNFSGNTFLSEDAAEKMGDLLMQRLKLSNAI